MRITVWVGLAMLFGIALWFSFTLLAILFCFGLVASGWIWLRAYLVEKDILNPEPGVPPEHAISHTVIEGDYEEIKK